MMGACECPGLLTACPDNVLSVCKKATLRLQTHLDKNFLFDTQLHVDAIGNFSFVSVLDSSENSLISFFFRYCK